LYPFHFAQRVSRRLDIVCVGAHCDDIEIGCGATLLALQEQHSRLRVHWLVLTSTEERRREALRAVEAFVRPSARGEIHVHALHDGHLPAQFVQAKAHLEDLRRAVDPDLVFSHHGRDRHQDHALFAEMTWQTFRDHPIWEYEIPKYDGDLCTPNAYVPCSADVAKRKVECIMKSFGSQHGKSWLKTENLLAVMRLRGLECRAEGGFAEAFHCRKLVFTAAGPGKADRKNSRKDRR